MAFLRHWTFNRIMCKILPFPNFHTRFQDFYSFCSLRISQGQPLGREKMICHRPIWEFCPKIEFKRLLPIPVNNQFRDPKNTYSFGTARFLGRLGESLVFWICFEPQRSAFPFCESFRHLSKLRTFFFNSSNFYVRKFSVSISKTRNLVA